MSTADLCFVKGQEYTLIVDNAAVDVRYLGKVSGHIFTYNLSDKRTGLISVDSDNIITDGKSIAIKDVHKVRGRITGITAKVMETFLKPKLEATA